MDTHKLEFEDDSFDVIVNRNVTWTLENPRDAYKEWMRVLKPGGSLIIFDACWYLWNYDKDLEKIYRENEKRVKEKYGRRIHQHTNPDDEKNEVEAYDAEINEIAPDDLGEDVDLVEEDDEDSEEEEE